MTHLREIMGWLVAAVWLISASAALGYFAFKDQRAFEASTVTLFNSQSRQRSAESWYRENFPASAAATVINVARPGCACNRYTEQHLTKINARYGIKGVRFVTIEPRTGLAWVDATPAALVFDGNGRLAYFGPYSSSAWCGSDEGLVEPVLDRVLQGQSQRPQPFYGSGCFCGSGRGHA